MTVLGHHTVAELKEWLAALDAQMQQIEAAHDAFAATWLARDAAATTEWSADWRALRTRYDAAHAKARGAMMRAVLEPLPNNVLPVEDEWQAVERALTKTPGAISKGDFQDLYNRLAAAQAKAVDFSKTPQPTASADADLSVFKAADATIRAGEAAAREVTPSKGSGFLLFFGLGAGLSVAVLFALRSTLR